MPALGIPDGFGVNIHFTSAGADELRALGESGARFIRMDFSWGRVERTKGEYDFAAYDGLVADMANSASAACSSWTTGIASTTTISAPTRMKAEPALPVSPERPRSISRARTSSGKYGTSRTSANSGSPSPTPTIIPRWLWPPIAAVRQADPQRLHNGPGLLTFPWDFFESMGQRGVFAKLDAVSVHPYRADRSGIGGSPVRPPGCALERYAPGRNIPIVSGEWGYTTVED